MRHALFALLALLGQAAAAADNDSFRVMKLEQDMRNLERQVQVLSRQVDELKQQLARAGDRSRPAAQSSAPAVASSSAWLDAATWNRVRAGMSELEVIGVLGPPTSMRQEGDQRVLLYALETGSSGFVSGSVTLRERAVVEVRKPELR
jgi:hypothetical protein